MRRRIRSGDCFTTFIINFLSSLIPLQQIWRRFHGSICAGENSRRSVRCGVGDCVLMILLLERIKHMLERGSLVWVRAPTGQHQQRYILGTSTGWIHPEGGCCQSFHNFGIWQVGIGCLKKTRVNMWGACHSKVTPPHISWTPQHTRTHTHHSIAKQLPEHNTKCPAVWLSGVFICHQYFGCAPFHLYEWKRRECMSEKWVRRLWSERIGKLCLQSERKREI